MRPCYRRIPQGEPGYARHFPPQEHHGLPFISGLSPFTLMSPEGIDGEGKLPYPHPMSHSLVAMGVVHAPDNEPLYRYNFDGFRILEVGPSNRWGKPSWR